jgi:hypothetical protein
MPELVTPGGQPVDVTPPDPDQVNRKFTAAMNDDGPDEQAPPRREPKPKADASAAPKVKRTRTPKSDQPRTTVQAAAPLGDEERAKGAKGYAQIGAGLALMIGKATKKDAYKADAVTIASAADDIADAVVQTAKADPKFAAALDKVLAAGPYAALISVGMSVGLQCARNHKPELKLPGTVDPAELLQAQAEAEADVAAAA